MEFTVISTEPESDAIDKVYKYAKENGDEKPKVIEWDFQNLSVEQINVFSMHGYTAAWIVPEGIKSEGLEIKEQKEHKYVAFLEKGRKIKGCGSLKRNFYTRFIPFFRIWGCDMANELKFIEQAINKAKIKKVGKSNILC